MRLVEAVTKQATGRRVAWAWVAFLGFSLVAFPLFDAVNGMPDVTPLDLRFFHGPDVVPAVLEEFGGPGRVAYVRSLLIADAIWPLVYGATLALTIAWGFGDAGGITGSERRRRLVLLAPAAVAFDYGENLLIALQIALFPDAPRLLAVASSGVSAVKWVFAGTATLVALAALLRRAGQSRRAQN